MSKMIIDSPEHKNLAHFLSLCRKGTSIEVLAHIRDCGYDAAFLNKEHYAIHHGPLYGYLPSHPLSEACMGDNLEVASLLLGLGVDPDPDIRWGRFKSNPPRKFAIGKPDFMKLFGNDTPWWKQSGPEMPQWIVSPNSLHMPEPSSLVWHIMRGIRLYTPKLLLHDDFCRLSAAMQMFICRFGIRHEELASYQDWLAANGADENLLGLLKKAWCPCAEMTQKRAALNSLVISSGLLERNRLFSLVSNIISPHDQISLIVDLTEQYETSKDKEFMKNAMELLLGAMIYKLEV